MSDETRARVLELSRLIGDRRTTRPKRYAALLELAQAVKEK